MKKAVKKPAARASVKKSTVKDLPVSAKSGGVKGGRKMDWTK